VSILQGSSAEYANRAPEVVPVYDDEARSAIYNPEIPLGVNQLKQEQHTY
jgi:hypothetical protein